MKDLKVSRRKPETYLLVFIEPENLYENFTFHGYFLVLICDKFLKLWN